MGLPTSGQISMKDIIDEKKGNTASVVNVSMQGMHLDGVVDDGNVDRALNTDSIQSAAHGGPDGAEPHSIDEFYGYDHDATASSSLTEFYGSSGTTSSKSACSQSVNVSYYHDGTGSIPATGDNVYADSSGDEALEGQYYRIMPTSGGSTTYRILVDAGAVSGTVATC